MRSPDIKFMKRCRCREVLGGERENHGGRGGASNNAPPVYLELISSAPLVAGVCVCVCVALCAIVLKIHGTSGYSVYVGPLGG